MFTTVKISRYVPDERFFVSELEYNLNEIRLASEATRVPSPPAFTPSSRSFLLKTKGSSSSAAGTLLIIWLVISPVKNSLF